MDTNDQLTELLGLEEPAPQDALAIRLAEQDECLLDELVAMRKRKGLTQTAVGEAIGRDQAAISNFERLGGDPHMSTVRRYALAVGASISHVVQDASPKTIAHGTQWIAGLSRSDKPVSGTESALQTHDQEVWKTRASQLEVQYAEE
ncbi:MULTISPECIES: helix-turn-helix domain-containing protein [Brevibacterium]|uniref:Helix-turn-helix domain-containing protein n=2 Tax=Brevibacterium TaxID=1696 RepID=A0A1H1PVV5_BRESA|nr:helix-turn-helix transcriptional regulator [Brevibacterium sandarakinum]SDS15107.1 Helix-turn-helix domain-containing protein [Brevibacterium sandarakinum]